MPSLPRGHFCYCIFLAKELREHRAAALWGVRLAGALLILGNVAHNAVNVAAAATPSRLSTLWALNWIAHDFTPFSIRAHTRTVYCGAYAPELHRVA